MDNEKKGKLQTALKDAGCPEEMIREVAMCGNVDTQERILKKHRAALLDDMHTSQKRIAVLDYIIRYLQGKETVL